MPQPQGVQPQPTPFTIDLGEARAPDGTTVAVLVVKKTTGQDVLFIPPAQLAELAEQMAAHAATLAKRPIIATAMPAVYAFFPGANGRTKG